MWHVFFIKSSLEDQVVDFLKKQVNRLNDDVPHRLFYPTRKLVHLDKGEQKIVSRALFPGYMFLETEEPNHFKKMMKYSTKFLTILKGGDLSLEAVRQDEINAILVLLNQLGEIEFSTGFAEKDRVRILSGPLKNYCGEITKINKRECKARIQLMMKT